MKKIFVDRGKVIQVIAAASGKRLNMQSDCAILILSVYPFCLILSQFIEYSVRFCTWMDFSGYNFSSIGRFTVREWSYIYQ